MSARGHRLLQAAAVALLALALGACTYLPKAERQSLAQSMVDARSTALTCSQPDRCAQVSSFREAGVQRTAQSTDDAPKHELVLLERGTDALAARLNLIRAAQRQIELKTFIYVLDDSGKLVLDALLDAADRGITVRLMVDQLYGLADPNLQAALAGYHRNFELRVYNPTFGEASTAPLEFAAGIVCCFRRFNQRMHSKTLGVDDVVAITGGRNIQDRYFDWDPVYNYRDRDLIVAGPAARDMRVEFDEFWSAQRTVRAEWLVDVARRWQKHAGPPPDVLAFREQLDEGRLASMRQAGADDARLRDQLAAANYDVGAVRFIADLPDKHKLGREARRDASLAMRKLIEDAQNDVLLQTPYLVLSPPARRLFREMHRREQPPSVRVSTNSLAATDAFPVYAISHKYKRTFLVDLGFVIHEFKPYPTDTPIDPAATGALGETAAVRFPLFGSASGASALSGSGPVPLRRAGVRAGLHAKSVVIDRRIAIVGTHNFDPRSDHWNTESMVVVDDATFANALAEAIEADMQPGNAWLIAPRSKPPVLSGLSYSLGKLSEALPIFDLWPFPYATSYQLRPGCEPVPWGHPRFFDCWEDVGDFPEVEVNSKRIYTRILTAFGAGLAPIL